MTKSLIFLIMLSSIAFITYGAFCLLTGHMRAEFERYGLSKFRVFVGFLELLGGLGLISGILFNVVWVSIFSSSGLCLLMILGTATRIRVRDPFFQWLPAILLGLINGWIAYGLSIQFLA